jgi:hypothetical protein
MDASSLDILKEAGRAHHECVALWPPRVPRAPSHALRDLRPSLIAAWRGRREVRDAARGDLDAAGSARVQPGRADTGETTEGTRRRTAEHATDPEAGTRRGGAVRVASGADHLGAAAWIWTDFARAGVFARGAAGTWLVTGDDAAEDPAGHALALAVRRPAGVRAAHRLRKDRGVAGGHRP